MRLKSDDGVHYFVGSFGSLLLLLPSLCPAAAASVGGCVCPLRCTGVSDSACKHRPLRPDSLERSLVVVKYIRFKVTALSPQALVTAVLVVGGLVLGRLSPGLGLSDVSEPVAQKLSRIFVEPDLAVVVEVAVVLSADDRHDVGSCFFAQRVRWYSFPSRLRVASCSAAGRRGHSWRRTRSW